MDEHEENFKDIFRYTDVEYTPDGYSDVYRWDDFLGIAGGHVYSAMDTIDSVSPGGEYEGDEPEHAYACEIVACCGLSDGVALFRPVSHDGADLIQVAFLRNDVDDATGAYTERFEAVRSHATELFAACQVQLAFIQADLVFQALDWTIPATDRVHFGSVYTSDPYSRRYISTCCLGAFSHSRFTVAREAVADIEKRSNAKNSPTNIVAAAKKAAGADVSADGAGSGKHI